MGVVWVITDGGNRNTTNLSVLQEVIGNVSMGRANSPEVFWVSPFPGILELSWSVPKE